MDRILQRTALSLGARQPHADDRVARTPSSRYARGRCGHDGQTLLRCPHAHSKSRSRSVLLRDNKGKGRQLFHLNKPEHWSTSKGPDQGAHMVFVQVGRKSRIMRGNAHDRYSKCHGNSICVGRISVGRKTGNSIRYTAIQSCRRFSMKKPARRQSASSLPILQSKTWSG